MDRQTLRLILGIHKQAEAGDADIDRIYSSPPEAIMPYLRQAHGLRKGSSWTEIGPVGQAHGTPAQYQRVPWSKQSSFEKKAEPPPPEGVSAKDWDEALSGKLDRMLHRMKIRKGLAKIAADGDHGIQDRYEFQGLPIAVENVAGSTRSGKDRDGHEWETKMKHDYGFIEGTKAGDGDAVDVYVGPKEDAPAAYVVHQHKPSGKGFDEDKVMLGFSNKRDAKAAYLKHYDDPKFLGPIDKVSVERLRELVASKKKLVKISSAQPLQGAMLEGELEALRKQAATDEKPKNSRITRFLRKAGPGLGGATGLVTGALLGARRGKALQGALAGLGTGATLGWVPDMAHGVVEGARELRR